MRIVGDKLLPYYMCVHKTHRRRRSRRRQQVGPSDGSECEEEQPKDHDVQALALAASTDGGGHAGGRCGRPVLVLGGGVLLSK